MIIVCFILFAPFTNNNLAILLHSISVPFIMIHWYLNDNQCVLSTIEKHIRKNIDINDTNQDDCFTCRIINPIYDFKENNADLTTFIYSVTTILWLSGLYKLYTGYQSGRIGSLHDLLIGINN